MGRRRWRTSTSRSFARSGRQHRCSARRRGSWLGAAVRPSRNAVPLALLPENRTWTISAGRIVGLGTAGSLEGAPEEILSDGVDHDVVLGTNGAHAVGANEAAQLADQAKAGPLVGSRRRSARWIDEGVPGGVRLLETVPGQGDVSGAIGLGLVAGAAADGVEILLRPAKLGRRAGRRRQAPACRTSTELSRLGNMAGSGAATLDATPRTGPSPRPWSFSRRARGGTRRRTSPRRHNPAPWDSTIRSRNTRRARGRRCRGRARSDPPRAGAARR